MLQSMFIQMNIADAKLQKQSGFVCAGFVANGNGGADYGYDFDVTVTPEVPTNKEQRNRRT